MSDPVSRRKFLRRSVAASMGSALALSLEEKALLAARAEATPKAAGEFPRGKIGDLEVSRLISGGNLISGFAHSRDLIYVSKLLKQYFTEEKTWETLERCEEQGINTAILRVDEHILGLITKYWKHRGGKIQWIAQAKPSEKDPTGDIQRAIDAGARAVFVHGGVCDGWVEAGKVELIGKALDHIKKQKVPAGVAAHALATTKACHEAGLDPDFYMKTLNSKSYWSAGPEPRLDSVWAETPEETVQFMKGIQKPWIAYKILGAGAIQPREGLQYAFESGADFACVGMFDFQVAEDVAISKSVLAGVTKRPRPWCG